MIPFDIFNQSDEPLPSNPFPLESASAQNDSLGSIDYTTKQIILGNLRDFYRSSDDLYIHCANSTALHGARSWCLIIEFLPTKHRLKLIQRIDRAKHPSLKPSHFRTCLFEATNVSIHMVPEERKYTITHSTIAKALRYLRISTKKLHTKLPALAIQGPISTLRLGLAMFLDITQMGDSYFMRDKNKPFPRNAQAAFWLSTHLHDGPFFYPRLYTYVDLQWIHPHSLQHCFLLRSSSGDPSQSYQKFWPLPSHLRDIHDPDDCLFNPDDSESSTLAISPVTHNANTWHRLFKTLNKTARYQQALHHETQYMVKLANISRWDQLTTKYLEHESWQVFDIPHHNWVNLVKSILHCHDFTTALSDEELSQREKRLLIRQLQLTHIGNTNIIKKALFSAKVPFTMPWKRSVSEFIQLLATDPSHIPPWLKHYLNKDHHNDSLPQYSHPMCLVATLNVVHMLDLSKIEASRVISSYNIIKDGKRITPIMKDSGSNVHLIPENYITTVGIPELSTQVTCNLNGIGTQQTLGTTQLFFGLDTHKSNRHHLFIYTAPDALILPADTGPKCPLISEILLEHEGYSWISSKHFCKLTTPEGFSANLERDPITGFWFLLAITSGKLLEEFKIDLIQRKQKSFPAVKHPTPSPTPSRDHTLLRIPQPPKKVLPPSVERIIRRAHEALGHVHIQRLLKLAKDNSVYGLEHLAHYGDPSDALTVCEGCVLGKAKSKSTPKLTTYRHVHPPWGSMTIDATGHIAHKSIQHSHYALAAVHSASLTPDGLIADDGGAGYVLLIGLHARSDTLLALQRIFTILQKPPLRIHSDNAPELCSKTADRFFLSLSINHTTPPAYEHHAVGKAERLWDSLKTLARAMMLHSGIPLEFWEFALKHATLIYNCTAPPPNGCGATRFEAYYGSKPDLSNILPFGALAYIKISKEQHKALDINSSFGQRSLAGVYLGQDDINGIVKHIIYSDRKLLATTTQNIYINPDIYPFRPAAVIPASIASTYLLKCKTPSLPILDQETPLTPETYLQIHVATRRLTQPKVTSPAPKLADSIQLTLDMEPAQAKPTPKTQWHQASIIGHSGPKSSRKYLIRWTGYGPEHDQWTHPKDITKALLQEYYDKLREQSTPQLPSGHSKPAICPKDVINGDFASIDVLAESEDPRTPQPLIDPLDFTLPRLNPPFKEVAPYNDASYTHLLPILTTKARDYSAPSISKYMHKEVMHAFEEYAQAGQVTSFDEDTKSWIITKSWRKTLVLWRR